MFGEFSLQLSSVTIKARISNLLFYILLGDTKIYPIRGQIIRVKAPWLNHIFLLDTKKTCYIIPNTHSVVLGGTKQQNYNLEFDQEDADDILR